MRRRSHGAVPAVALTVFACLGVVAVIGAANPSLREHLPSIRTTSDTPSRRVPVSVTPTARPSATRSPSRSASATPPATDPPSAPSVRSTTPPPATSKPVAPAPPRCTAGGATVRAAADSYVDQSSPRESFGRAGTLSVASRDKERNRRALVRFTLPSVPSGCTLRSAVLTMTAREASGRRILAGRAARGWNESTVTWANAPSASGALAGATVTGTTVRWTVTAQVAAMRSYGNYGFLLRDATESARGQGAETAFAARTQRGAPVLVLRWS